MTVYINDVYDILYGLGLTANYSGFFYLSYAVLLASENPTRLLLVTKWLYPEIAKHYNTSWKSVERGIRYVLLRIWVKKSPLLHSMMGASLVDRPTPARFIALLSRYCLPDRSA